jgi:hypothetical protein
MKDTITDCLKRFYLHFNNEVDTQNQDFLWDVLECEIYFINPTGHIRSRYREGQEFPDYKFNISAFSRQDEFMDYIDEFATDIETASMGRELEIIFISDRLPDGDVDTYEWQS